MHKSQQSIIKHLRQHQTGEMSTSELLKTIYPEEMREIQEVLEDPIKSGKSKKFSLLQKAKLHRRLTHHIKSLEKEDLIYCSNVLARGEKCFSLKVHQGQEVVVHTKGRKIVLSRPSEPNIPMVSYEQQGIVHKVMSEEWLTRVNAVTANAKKLHEPKDLVVATRELFACVNDVVAWYNVDYILNTFAVNELKEAMDEIHGDCEIYERTVNLYIPIDDISFEHSLVQLVNYILEKKLTHIVFVFVASSRELLLREQLFADLVALFAQHKTKLNFKNNDFFLAPILIGKAGTYTFREDDWKRVHKDDEPFVIGSGLAGVVVDLSAFYQHYGQAKILHDCVFQICKSLFMANIQLKQYAEHQFRTLATLKKFGEIKFFDTARNYIRLWNYDPGDEQRSDRLVLYEELNESIRAYTRTQEIIYMSCGMPTKFDLDFSVAFRRFDNKKLLTQNYEDVIINNREDFLKEENKELLLFHEKINRLMHNSYEVRVVRKGVINPAEIVREVQTLLTTFRLPFFCYEFEKTMDKPQVLTSYLKGDRE